MQQQEQLALATTITATEAGQCWRAQRVRSSSTSHQTLHVERRRWTTSTVGAGTRTFTSTVQIRRRWRCVSEASVDSHWGNGKVAATVSALWWRTQCLLPETSEISDYVRVAQRNSEDSCSGTTSVSGPTGDRFTPVYRMRYDPIESIQCSRRMRRMLRLCSKSRTSDTVGAVLGRGGR